jgi:hypothetical protein
MKHLLIGGAAVAALAIAAPVWAQPAPSAPPPGASAPGPAAPSAMPHQMNRMPAGGGATSERGTGPLPRTHHPRHAGHAARTPSAGSQADQLNQQELSRLQGTNPTTMNRMSVGGKATSGGPNQ